ncbi:MAG: PspC domain-containing protein [Bacteroidales bacterium]|nr:PspC domain-containing protein [Bacteroidales bacterium]MDD4673156.1 PspC domain-containing protein [Bacteroidales bacterium]MDY0348179.1 PspC domain-containing protein [Tenuifilaceae bacterium]
MKKTVTVSLGGMVFILQEDAYYKLDSYLKSLEAGFAQDPDHIEIMADIEARIAEHFKGSFPNSDDVIGLSEVLRVIEIMGNPNDIGSQQHSGKASEPFFSNRRKKLYRDTEGSVIGGVCSGLGYYWNIDTVLIRILFVIVALWGGGGVLIYVILWIVVPEARTVAERLEMTGNPVTAENIGKSFHGSGKRTK